MRYMIILGATPPQDGSAFQSDLNATVILLDWTGVDLTPQSTPYAKEAVELQDSNRVASQSTRFQYRIESIESWHSIQSIEDLLAFQFNRFGSPD